MGDRAWRLPGKDRPDEIRDASRRRRRLPGARRRADRPRAARPGRRARAAPAATPADDVDQYARDALNKMGAYLRTLSRFEVTADTNTEDVTDDGHKLQFSGETHFTVRRPDGFVIKVASGDIKTKAELLGQDDFIPWKRGVSL